MKKINHIELVTDFLSGGDAPADIRGVYHPEIISNHIESWFNDVVMKVWQNGKRFSDYSQLDAWAKKYKIGIVVDDDETQGYSQLPYPPVQLPNNGGIRLVCPTGDRASAYAPVENIATPVFSELEISTVDTTPTYRLEMNSEEGGTSSHVLRYEKLPVFESTPYVDVLMIVPWGKLDYYDDVALPGGMDESILEGVIKLLRAKPPEDKNDDNIANRQQ